MLLFAVPENIKKIGNKKYVLGPDRIIFGDAQQYCLSVGGTLAEPDLTQEAIEALSNGFHTEFADEIATSKSYKNSRIKIKCETILYRGWEN